MAIVGAARYRVAPLVRIAAAGPRRFILSPAELAVCAGRRLAALPMAVVAGLSRLPLAAGPGAAWLGLPAGLARLSALPAASSEAWSAASDFLPTPLPALARHCGLLGTFVVAVLTQLQPVDHGHGSDGEGAAHPHRRLQEVDERSRVLSVSRQKQCRSPLLMHPLVTEANWRPARTQENL